MKKVLIISTSYDEKKQLQEVVRMHDPGSFEFEATASFGQEASFWSGRPPAVLILHLPDDENLQPYFIDKIKRDLPRFLPIIFLSPRISQILMQLSYSHSKLRFFKMPMDPVAVYRALIDLTKVYKEGERQIHPRYQTHQPVEVSSDFLDGRIPAIMKNLSVSGAYFETDSEEISFNSQDLARISVYLGESARQYVFDVRVIWSKKHENGLIGYGVTFIDKEEVYNSLLKNI